MRGNTFYWWLYTPWYVLVLRCLIPFLVTESIEVHNITYYIRVALSIRRILPSAWRSESLCAALMWKGGQNSMFIFLFWLRDSPEMWYWKFTCNKSENKLNRINGFENAVWNAAVVRWVRKMKIKRIFMTFTHTCYLEMFFFKQDIYTCAFLLYSMLSHRL